MVAKHLVCFARLTRCRCVVIAQLGQLSLLFGHLDDISVAAAGARAVERLQECRHVGEGVRRPPRRVGVVAVHGRVCVVFAEEKEGQAIGLAQTERV
jgi:hypothetical protein